MSENEKKEVPPLPPVIAELLKQKGWSWPLSEENKKQIGEALSRLSGSMSVPDELREEVYEGMRGYKYHVMRKKDVQGQS